MAHLRGPTGPPTETSDDSKVERRQSRAQARSTAEIKVRSRSASPERSPDHSGWGRKPAVEWSLDVKLRSDEVIAVHAKFARFDFDYLVSKVKDALPSFSRKGELDPSYVDNSIRFLVHHFDVILDEQLRIQQFPPCSGADERIPLMFHTFARSLVGDRRVRMECLDFMENEMKTSQMWSATDKDKYRVAAAVFRDAEQWLLANRFLFARFVSLEEKQHSIKLVVLGASKAGKSSLITNYVRGFFADETRATVGVDFAYKVYQLPDYPGVSVRAQIWDTAGQERYNSITGGYLRGAHGVLLVYNLEEEEAQKAVELYAQVINDNAGPQVTTVLFGNRSDAIFGSYDFAKMSRDELRTLVVRADFSLAGCESDAALLTAAQNAVRHGRQGNHFWGSAKTGHGVKEALDFLISQATLALITSEREKPRTSTVTSRSTIVSTSGPPRSVRLSTSAPVERSRCSCD